MTLDTQVLEFQNYARQSLQSGQAMQALNLLTQAKELDKGSPTTLMLLGIAMSRMNQPVSASETFEQALAISPDDPKLLYNYAVHLYSFAHRAEALVKVKHALEVSPDHRGSLELLRVLEGDSARPIPQPATVVNLPRAGYEQAAGLHTILFIRKAPAVWSAVGWTLSVAAFTCFVLAIIKFISAAGSSADFLTTFTSGATYGWIQGLYMLSLIGTVIFGVIDLIDRRGMFAWLIVLVLLPLIGLGWLALPLYMTSRQ